MKTFFFLGGGGGVRLGEGVGGHRVDVNKVFMKIKKKKKNWLGRVGWGVRVDVNEERRIEVFVKIQKKKLGWGREGEGSGLGGQGGCKRRIEVFVKIQKKEFGGGGGGRGGGGGGGGGGRWGGRGRGQGGYE